MTDLVLYTRSGCRLCDDALDVCRGCGLEPEPVDISGDLALLRAYGDRIPVLRRVDTGAALDWPFDAGAVTAFLRRD